MRVSNLLAAVIVSVSIDKVIAANQNHIQWNSEVLWNGIREAASGFITFGNMLAPNNVVDSVLELPGLDIRDKPKSDLSLISDDNGVPTSTNNPYLSNVDQPGMTTVPSSVASIQPTSISDSVPIRYIVGPGESRSYQMTGIEHEINGTNIYVTINICSGPTDSEGRLPFDNSSFPLLYAEGSSNETTDNVMLYNKITRGFSNITISNFIGNSVVVDIVAPSLNSSYSGNWTYEVGVSSLSPVHSVNAGADLFLVDTDFAHALFITANYSQIPFSGSNPNVSDYDIYIYASDSDEQFSTSLSYSYCAISTGPALVNTKNSIVSTTTWGAGGLPKGQFFVNGLNKSTNYEAYMTMPNHDKKGGGTVFMSVPFVTNSEEVCQIIYDLDFCSQVAFAVPGNATSFSPTTLATFYDEMAQKRYSNFSKSLQNVPCNTSEELSYSIFRTCDDCADSYKNWLCAITIPRCMDWSAPQSYLFPRPMGTSRNPEINIDLNPGPYKEILPCSHLCNMMVQDCSAELGFVCPKRGHQGFSESYGLPSDDGDVTCSYPGAFYYVSSSTMISFSTRMTMISLAIVFMFI